MAKNRCPPKLGRVVSAFMNDPYLFQTVKDRADIMEAARHYGMNPDRKGWCLCPFHKEKTPSFHLYNQKYRCFGCGASGDVVDLTVKLLGVGPMEAVKRLNADMGLGIDLDGPVDVVAVHKARTERREAERFRAWREAAIRALTGRFYVLHRISVRDAPKAAGEATKEYAQAVKELPWLEYYLDLLTFGMEADIKNNASAIDEVVESVKERGEE